METYSSLGTYCFWLALALQTFLVRHAWRRRGEFPAFTAYQSWLLFSGCLMFLAFYEFSPRTYLGMYQVQTALDFVLIAGVIGEVLGDRRFGYAVGMLMALSLALGGFAFWQTQVCGMVISSAAFLSLFRLGPPRAIAQGTLVMQLFPAILYLAAVPYWTRFVPVFAWIVGGLIWAKFLMGHSGALRVRSSRA